MNVMRFGFLRRRRAYLAMLAVVFLVGYLLLAGSVDNTVTADDEAAIAQLQVDGVCRGIAGFDAEFNCIKSIQAAIRTVVPNIKCAGKGVTIEPPQFIQRGYGCCYDRARFTEKTLRHYGFETRHVAIYDVASYGIFGFLVPGIASHATSEVRTSKGWMGVDSNHPFLLLSDENEVFTFSNYKDNKRPWKDTLEPKAFYGSNLRVIYGLYSRHGGFHGANLPGPEFNLKELQYNFFD